MIELGKTLKAAREAKGLSIPDIAERTHMMSSVIAELEDENFSRFPAPIYGRGFVKLYCQAVGIDPAPMVAEFMEIYSGNREPAIRERVVAPPPPVPEPTDATPHETRPVDGLEPLGNEQLDLFSAATVQPSVPTPAAPEPVEAEVPPAKEHFFTHYSMPLRERASEMSHLTSAIGRWAIVASVSGLILWGAAVGVRALYRATSQIETAPVETAAVSALAATTVASDVKTSRTPIAVPPLYID